MAPVQIYSCDRWDVSSVTPTNISPLLLLPLSLHTPYLSEGIESNVIIKTQQRPILTGMEIIQSMLKKMYHIALKYTE